MKLDSLVAFFQHVISREDTHGIKDAFRFKMVLNSRKKGDLVPACYSIDGTPASDVLPTSRKPTRLKRKKQNDKVDLRKTILNPEESSESSESSQEISPMQTPVNHGLRTPAYSQASASVSPVPDSSASASGVRSTLRAPTRKSNRNRGR
jgi:hypothetical protein